MKVMGRGVAHLEKNMTSFLFYLSHYATITKQQLQVYFHPMPTKEAKYACLVLRVLDSLSSSLSDFVHIPDIFTNNHS
jgi:hypothetical protein